ncbi:MAG TPA: helix-turn-helix transcriptional regulator [Pseudolabrys sp.]|nr:helix-turn-helix transcriptional regulator [Pseudolabrys sp.]
MDIRRVIGTNVRKYRQAAGLSQEDLALRIEIFDQGYISGLEVGRRNPTAVTIGLLASALGVSAGQLFSTEGMNETWARGPIQLVSSRSRRQKISAGAK